MPLAEIESLDAEAIALEELMLGIRLKAGVDGNKYDSQKVQQLVEDGLLDAEAKTAGQLRLTRKGRLLADTVIRTLGF
jgi:oxygen-independent coproporphyrinogen-3 oxidase